MKRLVALAAVLAVVLVGCGDGSDDSTDALGGGQPSTTAGGGTATSARGGTATTVAGASAGEHADHEGKPTSTCSPSGTTLSLTASGTKFNTDCLAAPAGQAFSVNFDNKDSLSHNLMILESHSASEALFDAGIISGPGIKTLSVPALKAGTFAFHCKIHPGLMSGTFIVQ